MNPKNRAFWFPAKKYGYGWGLPARWQGWVALASLLALFAVGGFAVLPAHPVWFGTLTILLFGALIGLGHLKGEPTHWRWGSIDGWSRLLDEFAGRPNIWVESMKAKNEKGMR